MKTISIRELHEATGRYVRETRIHPLVVTERGHTVAVWKAFAAHELPGQPFPKREPKDLPRVDADSTRAISADRDDRFGLEGRDILHG